MNKSRISSKYFYRLATAVVMVFVILGATLLVAQPANANHIPGHPKEDNPHNLTCIIIPQDVCNVVLNNPTKTAPGAISPLINYIINLMVGIFGSIIVLIIIISAVQISASGGNEEAVKKGKENIFKATTGLVLLISFRAIIDLMNSIFTGVNTNVLLLGEGLDPTGLPMVLSNITSLASFTGGIVAVVFLIIGGIQYTASGGGEGIKKAKKTITYALAGLVISISAYGILVFIQAQLQK